jgi:arsenite/tail-anchored protein-transporting ATPase
MTIGFAERGRMALEGLVQPSLKMIFFGGKGGVGKTTCASITARYLADNNMETLLISTDPAHSLSDSLGVEIGDGIRQVESTDRLSAVEINAEKTSLQFKSDYEDELKKIFDTSTYLDEEDINSILDLPIPGIDEVMGLKAIVDLIEKEEFEKYIVDTAPTGHALRLLALPGLLDDWIKVMAKMRWKYRYMVRSFSGLYSSDSADDFLVSMKKAVKNIEGLLKDQDRCTFIVVTIAEDMAVRETERLINCLKRYGMNVRQLLVNNVIPLHAGCRFCQARRDVQDKYIGEIEEKFNELNITIVPLQSQEVKGRDTLQQMERLLFDL